jgi:pimeloyl-ACP methyl ester carboxylesterase
MAWRLWGEGRPVVLFHGASGSWTHWLRIIEPLATRFRLLVPDMPGFGDSDVPPGPQTAEALADAMTAGLEALLPASPPVDMVGFSFGGIVAGLVAARMGHRVRTLALLGAGGLDLPPMTPPALAQLERGMTPADVERVHRENLAMLMIANRARIDDLAVHLQMENVRKARFRIGRIPESEVLLRAMPDIRARLTSIVGEHDAFVWWRLAEYRAVLESFQPDLDFRIIRGAGHWTPYEAPEAVAEALVEMLRPPR